jgi:hypothetical protein
MLLLKIVCNRVLLMFPASFHRDSEESCTEQHHSGWFRHDNAGWRNRKTWSIEPGVRNRKQCRPCEARTYITKRRIEIGDARINRLRYVSRESFRVVAEVLTTHYVTYSDG